MYAAAWYVHSNSVVHYGGDFFFSVSWAPQVYLCSQPWPGTSIGPLEKCMLYSHSRNQVLPLWVSPYDLKHLLTPHLQPRIHRWIRNYRRSPFQQDCHRVDWSHQQVRCHQSSFRCPLWWNWEMDCQLVAIQAVRTHHSLHHIWNYDTRWGQTQEDGRKGPWILLLEESKTNKEI